MRLKWMGPNKPYSGVACYCCESSWEQNSFCIFKVQHRGLSIFTCPRHRWYHFWVDINVGHYRAAGTNHLLNTPYYISHLNRRDPSGILFTIKISPVCSCLCSFSSAFFLLAAILLALLPFSKTCCKDASQMFNA